MTPVMKSYEESKLVIDPGKLMEVEKIHNNSCGGLISGFKK